MATAVVKLDPHAPNGEGLELWEPIPAAALVSGSPVQRGQIVHENKAQGLMVGVWDCTPMVTRHEPYSVNEFMLLLDGEVTIVDAEGREETVFAGQPFVLPKGFHCQWKQERYLRKFFLIFDDPSGAAPEGPGQVIRPLPYGPTGGLFPIPLDPDDFLGPMPTQRQHLWYQDPTGQMAVGTWDATAYERPVTPFNRNELMHILEGSVTITGAVDQTFHAGDTFFIPEGAPTGWRSEGYVRKFYCSFRPKAG